MLNKEDVELILLLDDIVQNDGGSITAEICMMMAENFLDSGYNLPWKPLRDCVEEWYQKEWKAEYDE